MKRLRMGLVVLAHLLVLLHNLVPHSHQSNQPQAGLLSRALSLVAHTSGESFRFDVVRVRQLRTVVPAAAPRQQAACPAPARQRAPRALLAVRTATADPLLNQHRPLRGPPRA